MSFRGFVYNSHKVWPLYSGFDVSGGCASASVIQPSWIYVVYLVQLSLPGIAVHFALIRFFFHFSFCETGSSSQDETLMQRRKLHIFILYCCKSDSPAAKLITMSVCDLLLSIHLFIRFLSSFLSGLRVQIGTLNVAGGSTVRTCSCCCVCVARLQSIWSECQWQRICWRWGNQSFSSSHFSVTLLLPEQWGLFMWQQNGQQQCFLL